METQPTRLKFGAFLKSYLKQSLQVFKHPKQLLPTAILTVVWMVLGILQIKVKENLPMQVLNFITYAQGGLYGGVVSAIGGILGKVVVAAFVNALIVPLFQGKMPFRGAGNGVKDLFKSISLKSRSAVAPLLKGFGAALLLYGLSNISGRPENTMAGIMAAVSLVLAMGKKNGFLWNFAFSYANSVTKGKSPDYYNVLRALTGMTLGFALGVGLNAAGIGLVGIIGIVALVLGWILGMGTKKEAVVSALLIILTLVPAPEAQAAKPNAWVLVGKETTVSQPSLIFEHDGGGIRNIAGDITHYSFLTVSPAYNTAITIEGTVSGLHGQYKEGQTVNGTYSFSYSGIDPEAIENGKSVHLSTRVWYNAEDLEKLGIKIIGQWDYGCVWISHNSPKSGEYSFTFPERGEDSLFPVKDDIYVVYELTIDAIGNGEIYLTTTYHFQWNGKPMKEEGDEGVVEAAVEEAEEYVVEESLERESTAEALVNLVKEWLEKEGEDVHTDEADTVIRDIVAGIMAGGTAAAAAGGAAGGAGGAPFGGDFPGGGEGPEGGKTEEEKEWERQMKEYEKWEKGKLDKYTRKNPDGTINVTDPSTGKTSVFYPKEGGGYENENGTSYSNNDLANWLDDRERNSEYYKENAATAERNLEDWRKRNEELKDFDRKEYEKKKADLHEKYRKEDRARRIKDIYNADSTSRKDLEMAIKKTVQRDLEAVKDEEDKVADKMDRSYKNWAAAQTACDVTVGLASIGCPPLGKAYNATKTVLGRSAQVYSKIDDEHKQSFTNREALWAITKGAAIGGLEAAVTTVIDNKLDDALPVDTSLSLGNLANLAGRAAGAADRQFINSALDVVLDGKKKEDVVKDMKKAAAFQVLNNVFGAVVKEGARQTKGDYSAQFNELGSTSLNKDSAKVYQDTLSRIDKSADQLTAAFDAGMNTCDTIKTYLDDE